MASHGRAGPLQNCFHSPRIDRRSPLFTAGQQPGGNDTDNSVADDSDASNASVDFLATLRQIDPERASDLERRYDLENAH